LKGILRGLTENEAITDPRSGDRRLRGRTYAIPFESVWQASVALSGGALRGWSIRAADDQVGLIQATAKTLLFGWEADVRVNIRLDENAQTRVDLWTASTSNRGDFGRSRRWIGKFLRRLDRQLEVRPGQILDPTRAPAWIES
jgi:hypothetical protein